MIRLNVFLDFLKVFRIEVLIVAMTTAVFNVLSLIPTLYMLQVYDRVMVSKNEITLIFLSGIVLFLYVIWSFSDWVRLKQSKDLSKKVEQWFDVKVFETSFSSSLNPSITDWTAPQSNLNGVVKFISGPVFISVFDLPWALLFISVLFLMSFKLGVACFIFIAIQFLISRKSLQKLRVINDQIVHTNQDQIRYLKSKVDAAETVEAMGMTDNLLWRWKHHLYKTRKEENLGRFIGSFQLHLTKYYRSIVQSLTLAFGAYLVVKGELSSGSMIASNMLMSKALSPLDQINGSWRQIQEFLNSLNEVLKLEVTKHNLNENKSAFNGLKVEGLSINLDDGRQILHDISFDINKGDFVIVSGESSSGKSTLLKAILGLIPASSGKILSGVKEINSSRLLADTCSVGFMSQDSVLLNGTVAENISRFGEVESDKIIEASSVCGLHDFILRLPKGYDTVIDKKENRLSGGQIQRICLARAIYSRPDVIILDEPNSNLDDRGEKALIDVCKKMKSEGVTIILVDHRNAFASIANKLIKLESGKII